MRCVSGGGLKAHANGRAGSRRRTKRKCRNHLEEEEEGFYKFLPANTADRLCQSWQSCSNHHEI